MAIQRDNAWFFYMSNWNAQVNHTFTLFAHVLPGQLLDVNRLTGRSLCQTSQSTPLCAQEMALKQNQLLGSCTGKKRIALIFLLNKQEKDGFFGTEISACAEETCLDSQICEIESTLPCFQFIADQIISTKDFSGEFIHVEITGCEIILDVFNYA